MYFVKRSQQKMPYKSQIHLKVLILLDILGFAFIGILRELAVCSWGGWDEQTHYHLYYLLVFVSDASRLRRTGWGGFAVFLAGIHQAKFLSEILAFKKGSC